MEKTITTPARELEPGSEFMYHGERIIAVNVLFEDEPNTSQAFYDYAKGHVVITYKGRNKIRIPLDEQIIEFV